LIVKLTTSEENQHGEIRYCRYAANLVELAGRLHALVQASRLDPGVTTYNLHRSIEDPALWFLYERCESHEHLNRQLQNAVVRGFLAEAAALVDGNVDIRTFRMVYELPGA
jgi:quinol monooxygenase YgiN